MTVEGEELLQVPSTLVNLKLEKLYSLGKEINETRSRIKIASDHLGSEWAAGSIKEGLEDLALARESLRGDLEKEIAEARELMPTVEELVLKFEEQIQSIENGKKLHQGLARIEEMRGKPSGATKHRAAARKDNLQVLELRNLITALSDLKRDLTSRREVISCPRCSSHDFEYRVTPSELGFSLYRCSKCDNAWRVQHFSIHIG